MGALGPVEAGVVAASATADSVCSDFAGAAVVHEVDGAYDHDELAPVV